MVIVKFQPIYKNFRYEVARTDSGEYYLVDMGVPLLSWFILVYSYLLPRRCYPISNETATILLSQKEPNQAPAFLAAGLGIALTTFVRHTDTILSLDWEITKKWVVVFLIVVVTLAVRFYYMKRAASAVLNAGAIFKQETVQFIRIKPVDKKPIARAYAIMLMLLCGLVGFVFMIFEPNVNFIILLVFAFLCFAYLVFSARILFSGSVFAGYKR
jgi:uncharacterized membrane protein (TIGR01218 family)